MDREKIKDSDCMNASKTKCQRSSTPSIGFAVLLIAFGAVMLAARIYDWVGMSSIVFSWAMLIVVFGIIFLFHRHLFSGLAFIGTGIFFIIPKLAAVFPQITLPANFIDNYWGALVIYIGVILLLGITMKQKKGFNHTHYFEYYRGRGRRQSHQNRGFSHYERMKQQCEEHRANDRHWFSHSVAFGDNEYIFLEPTFNGGEINVAFGDSKLDLRKTDIADGITDLYINVVFGNCTIILPQDWVISTADSKIFCGKITDKRIFFDTKTEQQGIKTLNILGSTVFGNLELRN
ncbi:MAG: LiaF-related protein [Bacteroidales bacterium]|jgi:predicted membrane protein|nr:LiaF-related protein [Bacteroidales bacterium]